MNNYKNLQELYKEWRKKVSIEGVPSDWLADEKNIKAFSKFANLEKDVDFHIMLDLENNLDFDDIFLEIGKKYITNKNYNLEDGSFVKKGTQFWVISKERFGYKIKFENKKGCVFEDSSRQYYIDELDLEDFCDL